MKLTAISTKGIVQLTPPRDKARIWTAQTEAGQMVYLIVCAVAVPEDAAPEIAAELHKLDDVPPDQYGALKVALDLAGLREQVHQFAAIGNAGCLLADHCLKVSNRPTREWLAGLAARLNGYAEAAGMPDRCVWDRYCMVRAK